MINKLQFLAAFTDLTPTAVGWNEGVGRIHEYTVFSLNKYSFNTHFCGFCCLTNPQNQMILGVKKNNTKCYYRRIIIHKIRFLEIE